MEYIARIHSDFPTKFGIPRQSGLTDALISKIVFEPKFRNPDCLRGIEQWSHLWLLWHFDRIEDGLWSPTVAPPKLGGKTRVGVFATRSPFRPNPIGLSSVKLAGVELHTKDGPVLYVAGADLADRTPIYDIKPYLPYADSHPDAVDAFSSRRDAAPLTVEFPDALLEKIPAELAARVASELSIPIIGIGAGGGVDGQVLVMHDMLGINMGFSPRFLRRYANIGEEITRAVQAYIEDVKTQDFPNEKEQY